MEGTALIDKVFCFAGLVLSLTERSAVTSLGSDSSVAAVARSMDDSSTMLLSLWSIIKHGWVY